MPQALYYAVAGKSDNGLMYWLKIRPRRLHGDALINLLILWLVQRHMPGYNEDFNIFNYPLFFWTRNLKMIIFLTLFFHFEKIPYQNERVCQVPCFR